MGREWALCPGRAVKRYVEAQNPRRREDLPIKCETASLYTSQCTPTALAEMFDEHPSGADAASFAVVAEVFANPVFEPFAFVVSSGFVASVAALRQSAVSVSRAVVLPLKFAAAFETEGESGK